MKCPKGLRWVAHREYCSRCPEGQAWNAEWNECQKIDRTTINPPGYHNSSVLFNGWSNRPGHLAGWPFMKSKAKRADEKLTSADLQDQYGYMTPQQERAYRQKSQVMGRPLTRAEQRRLKG